MRRVTSAVVDRALASGRLDPHICSTHQSPVHSRPLHMKKKKKKSQAARARPASSRRYSLNLFPLVLAWSLNSPPIFPLPSSISFPVDSVSRVLLSLARFPSFFAPAQRPRRKAREQDRSLPRSGHNMLVRPTNRIAASGFLFLFVILSCPVLAEPSLLPCGIDDTYI